MAEELHTTLTFVWDGDNGRVDRASLQRLSAEDRILIMDFLVDVRAEAERIYEEFMMDGGIFSPSARALRRSPDAS